MPWLSFFICNCPNSYAATRNRTHISRVAPNSRGLFEGRPTNWATRPRLLTVLKDPTIVKPTTKRIVQKTWLGFIQETSLDRMNSSSVLVLLFSTQGRVRRLRFFFKWEETVVEGSSREWLNWSSPFVLLKCSKLYWWLKLEKRYVNFKGVAVLAWDNK